MRFVQLPEQISFKRVSENDKILFLEQYIICFKILNKFLFFAQCHGFWNMNSNSVPSIAFTSKEKWERGEVGRNRWLSIYTDGSKLDNRVKGIVFLTKLDIRIAFQLTDHCNVPSREHSNERKPSCCDKSVLTTIKMFIYTDSKAALKSLKYLGVSSKVVKKRPDLLRV